MVDLANDELLREMTRGAEFVIAVSDYSRELLAKTCPESAHKIHRLYNGIALGDFTSTEPTGASDRPLRLVSIGRLIEFKGFHILINAIARLRESGIAMELEIVGDGPWRERLQAQVEALGLVGLVTLCGVQSQDQVRALLADADAFALACVVGENGASDVLPTVIAEAMAAGLPVVSTYVAGVPEMVAHGATGLLAEPSSVDAFTEALRELANGTAEWRSQLGAAGSHKARAQFDQMASAENLEQRFRAAGRAVPSVCDAKALVVMSGSSDHPSIRAELAVYTDKEAQAIEVLSMRLGAPDADAMRLASAGKLNFFPDGVVLESIWRSRPEWRVQLDEIRRDLGTAVDGEDFYLQARRAVWLADTFSRQSVPHLRRVSFRLRAVRLAGIEIVRSPPEIERRHRATSVTAAQRSEENLGGFRDGVRRR